MSTRERGAPSFPPSRLPPRPGGLPRTGPPLPFWGRPHLPPGALTPGAATAPRGAPGGQFSAEQPAWGTLSGPFTLIHLPICKPNQPWPPEGPPYATGQVGSDRPATGPQGGRAQNWKPSRPQWQQVPAPPSPPLLKTLSQACPKSFASLSQVFRNPFAILLQSFPKPAAVLLQVCLQPLQALLQNYLQSFPVFHVEHSRDLCIIFKRLLQIM